MTQRLVMLDANLIISAFDEDAVRTEQRRKEARDLIRELSSDNSVKFVTTPIIRYEVLCGTKTPENEEKLKSILNDFKIYEIGDSVANCAVEIFKFARQRSIDLKDPNVPNKYKFDIFHAATAKTNQLELKTDDVNLNSRMSQLNLGN